MKRIAAIRDLRGHARGDAEVKVPSGISCPATGWWTASAIPQTRTYVLKGLSMPCCAGRQVDWLLVRADSAGGVGVSERLPGHSGNCIQDGGRQIWPDCRD